jgi:cytochrome c
MYSTRQNKLVILLAAVGVAISLAVAAPPSQAHENKKHEAPANSVAATVSTALEGQPTLAHRLVVPDIDAQRGRQLFVEKGCFACHSINGVGGHDATNLDAHTMDARMNPFDFTAKMWAMAPAMIAAQEEALGEQILFTGQELADIIAFVHDDEAQHDFSMADIPAQIRGLMHHQHGEAPAHQKEIGHHHGEGMDHD